MNIEIIAVGKIKEKYLNKGIEEYIKRLQKYAKVTMVEVDDEPTQENLRPAEKSIILEKEANRILSKIGQGRKIIVLAIEGKLISSEELATTLSSYGTYGQSKVTFIIGGSLGLADRIKNQADLSISFGRITFPHQLMRLVLVEQIYRSFRIINGHAYHK